MYARTRKKSAQQPPLLKIKRVLSDSVEWPFWTAPIKKQGKTMYIKKKKVRPLL